MDAGTTSDTQRKRRTACDQCHASKVKCPGGPAPCSRCESNSLTCHYSFVARIGKPPGSRNKKTLERLRASATERANADALANTLAHPDPVGRQQLSPAATLQWTHDGSPSHTYAFGSRDSISNQVSTDVSSQGRSAADDPSFQSLDHLFGLFDDPFSKSQESWNTQSNLTPHTGDDLLATPLESSGPANDSLRPLSDMSDLMLGNIHIPTDLGPEKLNRSSCICFEQQTRELAQLRYLERQGMLKVDVLLNSARRVADASEKLLRCSQCGDDAQMLMSTVMAFQTIFRWAKELTHAPGTPCPDPEIQMGQYEISRQEAIMLKAILVARTYEKLQAALMALKRKVEAIMNDATRSQLWDFEKGELRSLEHSVATLLQTASALEKKVKSA